MIDEKGWWRTDIAFAVLSSWQWHATQLCTSCHCRIVCMRERGGMHICLFLSVCMCLLVEMLVCVFSFMYVSVSACLNACVHVHRFECQCMCLCFMFECLVCVCTFTCMVFCYMFECVCMHACRFECLFVFTVCVCVCMDGCEPYACACSRVLSCVMWVAHSAGLLSFPSLQDRWSTCFLKERDYKRKWPLSYERSQSCRDKSPVCVCIKSQSLWQQIRCMQMWLVFFCHAQMNSAVIMACFVIILSRCEQWTSLLVSASAVSASDCSATVCLLMRIVGRNDKSRLKSLLSHWIYWVCGIKDP